ncbi:MAG: nitrite/sulfite reductase [Erysipelotrichaceae bacterium]|nr:nitrite/sulfite reductase [Erysipelotrichaceae bacterium]
MKLTDKINPMEFEDKIDLFEEKTKEFYAGKMSQKDYKGFSGKYGSYAQRGAKANMLRLRMNGGRLTREKLKYVLDKTSQHDVRLLHFTTCQTIQMHNLSPEAAVDIMRDALKAGIVCYGGGGDYPRNVMCSPLTGTEKGEYFDVMPYALAASEFLIHFIDAEKMPRKLKVAFSNSKANVSHATVRDLGFAANENGTFDVYAAGGLGNNSRLGVEIAKNVDPSKVLYYIYAMIETFKKYGNYENRAKARTRYMVETLGGEEEFRKAYLAELDKVTAENQIDLTDVQPIVIDKQPSDTLLEESWFVLPQKQDGLYTVRWHPIGGSPDKEVLKKLYEAIEPMDQVEIRLSPEETAYIINLNGDEALKVQDIIKEDAAKNPLESSTSCIGASICQVGLRDSQALLTKIVRAVQEADIADGALPQIHISGCPSSCGTHQLAPLGFRGFLKMVDKKPHSSFVMYAFGNEADGQEKLAEELGNILEDKIPEMIVELGKTVQDSGMNFKEWLAANPEALKGLADKYAAD